MVVLACGKFQKLKKTFHQKKEELKKTKEELSGLQIISSRVCAMKDFPRSSSSSSSSSTMSKYSAEEIISAVSFVAVFSLLQLPFEKIDGSPVPTIIFKDRASYFHAFVLGLNFAFCGGVITISLRQIYPKIADISRYLSILSMLVAAGIFSALAVPWAAGALFSGSRLSIASA